MAKVVVVNGAEAGSAYDLAEAELVVGRQAGVEIKLNGTNVSRRHARLFRDGTDFFVEDLNSSNGTYLNGTRIDHRSALKPRDEIRIGPYVLRFESEAAPAEVTIRARTQAHTANLELYRENAVQKLQTLLQLWIDLGRSLDVDHLLAELLKNLFAVFPHAERGLVVLMERDTPTVRAHKSRSGGPESPQFSRSVLQTILAEGVGVIAEDLHSDMRFADAQSICSLGVRSLVCVPLQGKNRKVFGLLQLERMGMGHKFTAEDLNFLTAIGLQVSITLENAQLHQELIQRQRIERELTLAREIQLGYLPKSVPKLPVADFDLYGELHPANEISGDFYDYFPVGQNRLALAVADVSGKGMPAALFMSMVRALLRNVTQAEKAPGTVLQELNNALVLDNPQCYFVTLALCIFDPRTGMVQSACGGHPAPIIRNCSAQAEAVAIEQGPLLGFDFFERPLPTCTLQLARGDSLLLYTDGLTEAPAPTREMFGPERLLSCFCEHGTCTLRECAAKIRNTIVSFTGSVQQEDDITLLLLRRH